MPTYTPHVVMDAGRLREFATAVLAAGGVPEEGARLTADCLVAGNLRGVDSHGVLLLAHYVEQLEARDMDPLAAGRVALEAGACMVYDGQNGVGQVISATCCDHAVRLAREHGLGFVIARESNHFGIAGYWAKRISDAGMIGLALCDASPQVPPWQGRQGRLGTNPISMSVPHPEGKGWLLDMATTTVAFGKVEQALFEGEKSVPAGWILDAEGRPKTDLTQPLMLMPLGGYKGTGLATLVHILGGVLGGGAMSTEIGGIRRRGRPVRTNQTFIAIDINRFMPVSEFEQRMDWLVQSMRSSLPAAGYDEVLVAGEPELRCEAERFANGIPIPKGTWENVVAAAERLGVTAPESRIP